MKILALEFSSPQRSVAVVDSNGNRAKSFEVLERSAAKTMKPLRMIEDALKGAELEREQIECVVVGLGPGSYTGIRTAIALAQGWQLARGVKLLGISSAECISAQAQVDGLKGRFNVVIDAQREEFYLAGYDNCGDEVQEFLPLRIARSTEVRQLAQAGEQLIGPEVTRWFPEGRVVFPRAAILALLATGRYDYASGQTLTPIYLREVNFVKAPPPREIK